MEDMSASIIAICEELADAKGQIPISRLADAMRLLGMNPTDQDVGTLQRRALSVQSMQDDNEDGQLALDSSQFGRLMEDALAQWLAADQAQQLLHDFQVFDKDRTGRMSTQKLVEIMKISGNSFTELELEEMLLNSGVEGGTVDYKDVVYKHFFGARSRSALGDWGLQHRKPDPLQDASALREVAKMKADRGKLQDALGLYRDALVCSPACSSNQPGLAISSSDEALLDGQAAHSTAAATLHDMARLKEMLGEEQEALSLYLRALEIREKVLGPKHFYVATTLDSIANLQDRMGQVAEALDFACRSLSIWERFFGPEHSHVAKILYNLAGRRDFVGDLAGSLDFYQRALSIFQRVNARSEVADALDGIADLKWRSGETDEAILLYNRELSIREELLGVEHPEVVELREFIASLHP
ncbi:unnamed protein product [Durusdinium trenchii]|uniref:EF-hand domain-containing protein n=1 Tax=Durusdinium trenchii TaxID=1381693 RepID=A0ABP0LDP9_9DINO